MNRKTALITGSSHGIGKAVAIALARNGYDVAINYCNDKNGAEDTCEQARALGAKAAVYQADVSNVAAMEAMFAWFEKEFGGMDLMVNNAGVSEFHPILEVTEAQFDRINGIDWKGTFFGTQFAAKNMVAHKIPGVVINMCSNHVDACFPDASIYAPCKGAVATFTRNAAMELAEHGIRVVAFAPGYTKVWSDDNPINQAMDRIIMKRFASPEEVAEILVFLASEKCSYMTGTRITVDGGALLPSVTENFMTGGQLLMQERRVFKEEGKR